MNATKETSRVREFDEKKALVELFGELDAHDLKTLKNALDDALSSGLPAFVDLSGVSFLDVGCARELAARSRPAGNRLRLCNPSWQVRASLEACGFGEQAAFYPLVAWMDTEEEAREVLACAV